jgi:hypothetical protein
MRALLVLGIVLSCSFITTAQTRSDRCARPERYKAGKSVDPLLLQQRREALGMEATTPYIIKLYVVIFANSSGAAANAADVKRQIDNMRGFYAAHNICFILSAIEQVQNADLMGQDVDEEESELEPYLRSNHITIFVHESLWDDDGDLNGYAYGIPNNYLSIVAARVSDTVNISTLAHEMGHDLGLYHTFESAFGWENRARSGSCRDCEDDGDYLCDTQADRELPASSISATTCQFTGTWTDDCGDNVLMEPQNIMTYGRRACRDHFSSGQGSRARDFIISESMLSDALAVDNLNVTLPVSYSSGVIIYVARTTVTFDAPLMEATGSARFNSSSKAITLKPGAHFHPTSSTGYAEFRVNPYCN